MSVFPMAGVLFATLGTFYTTAISRFGASTTASPIATKSKLWHQSTVDDTTPFHFSLFFYVYQVICRSCCSYNMLFPAWSLGWIGMNLYSLIHLFHARSIIFIPFQWRHVVSGRSITTWLGCTVVLINAKTKLDHAVDAVGMRSGVLKGEAWR